MNPVNTFIIRAVVGILGADFAHQGFSENQLMGLDHCPRGHPGHTRLYSGTGAQGEEARFMIRLAGHTCTISPRMPSSFM